MNYYILAKLIGYVLTCEAVLMCAAAAVSLIYSEGTFSGFAITILLLLAIGLPLSRIKNKGGYVHPKEGFVIVALSWFLLALFGAIPFYLSGYFKNFMDCFFESVSGFTTTGATLLTNVEVMPKGILFWRSFTQWIGGMGVLILMLTMLPMNASYFTLLTAESPGPVTSKVKPRLKDSAKVLYLIYAGMTLIPIITMVALGAPLFDSVIHGFGTAGTGGFSNKSLSLGGYENVALEMTTAVFMLLFGVSFNLYYYSSKKSIKSFFKNEEMRLYVGIVFAATLFVTLDIMKIYGSGGLAFQHSFFQVSSIITTTGYFTADYAQWPTFSQMILVMLMLVGSCAGSTGGGIKIIRILILGKAVKYEISRIVHPRVVKLIKIDGKAIESPILWRMTLFFFVYILILVLASIVVALEGYDVTTTVTSVIAALGNIGSGLELVGPMGNYSSFSALSKGVLSFCMIAGRLEIFPVLVLFAPSPWKKSGC